MYTDMMSSPGSAQLLAGTCVTNGAGRRRREGEQIGEKTREKQEGVRDREETSSSSMQVCIYI